MAGEKFKSYTFEMAKIALKILHHGWRKIEIYTSEMAKMHLK